MFTADFLRVGLVILLCSLHALCLSPPPPRITPPEGASVVRQNTTSSSEFPSLIAAVATLPADNSAQTIFVFPGTYEGQVNIQRSGPVIVFGYTTDPAHQTANTVTLVASVPASAVGGSNDLSGTLRIHTNNVSIYNLNVRNDYGPGSQAIAVSNYGSQVGMYACGIYGFQDTLLSNQGTQIYLQGYIQGAVDFIFGRLGQAYFEGNTIAVSSAGYVTASGRERDNVAIYVFNENNIVLAPGAASNTSGGTYLGRPWADYARVIFKSTTVTVPLNPAIWSIWHADEPNTDHVLFAEFNTTGSGIPSNAARPDFVTMLSKNDADAYDIASAVGDGWEEWVDMSYLLRNFFDDV